MPTDLREFFVLDERTNDQVFRKMALESFSLVRESLRSRDRFVAGLLTAVDNDHSPILVFNLSKLTQNDGLHGNLLLKLTKENGSSSSRGSFTQADSRGRPRITLNVKGTTFMCTTADEWKTIVLEHGDSIMDFKRETYVHEFVHYLDSQRIGGGVTMRDLSRPFMAKDRVTDHEKYFNSPHELNAFTQSAFSKVESEITMAKDAHHLQMIMGKTPQDFAKRVRWYFPTKMWDLLSPESKRKIMTRSYQLWQDTLGGAQATP